MTTRTLREFLKLLEARGELRRVEVSVSPRFEVAEIVDRLGRRNGPAVLFERVEGASVPMAANLLGSPRRLAWALGVERLDEIGERIGKLIALLRAGLPETVGDKVRLLGRVRELAGTAPRLVKGAACQEVIETIEPTFARFPLPIAWPGDPGPALVDVPVAWTDHDGGRRLEAATLVVLDDRRAAFRWSDPFRAALPRGGEAEAGAMPVAVVVGVDPATDWAAGARLPPSLDPLGLAGFLRGQSVALTRGVTVDVAAPAEAEIIFEGRLDLYRTCEIGPLAEATGVYSPPSAWPVFELTAVTHRRDPRLVIQLAGRPPNERAVRDQAAEGVMLPLLRLVMPEVVDLHLPPAGAGHNLVVVSIRKEYPGQARKVIYGVWGAMPLAPAKVVVVVDEDVDVRRPDHVLWRVGANVDPRRDLVLADGPLHPLDHASPTAGFGAKLGIDATRKRAAEGHPRVWPDDVAPAETTRRLVDRRWGEYGLP